MSAADRPGRRKVKKSGGKRRFPVSVPIPRRRKDRQVETPVEDTGVSGPEKDGAAPQGEEVAASTGGEDTVPSAEDAVPPGGKETVPPDADGAATERPPGLDAEVAQAVLEVADRLTSPDLRRRLAEAVGPLPGATVIVPGPGARFDPDVHEWVSSRPPPREDLRETVAETLHAGLADRTGRLLRPARVIVYDVPEE